jgi:hypothetical protein
MVTCRSGFSLFSILILVFISAGFVKAQETEHFTFTSNTGNNMTVLVKLSINPSIDGETLEDGDEIGVYNDDGLCVGATVWNGKNCTITVWGDNDQTDDDDGMTQGDTLRVRIWDESESNEYEAEITFEDDEDLTYGVDAIAIARSLEVSTTGVLVSGQSGKFFGTATGSFHVYDMKGRVVQCMRNHYSSGIHHQKNMRLPTGAFLIKGSDKEIVSVRKYTAIR